MGCERCQVGVKVMYNASNMYETPQNVAGRCHRCQSNVKGVKVM